MKTHKKSISLQLIVAASISISLLLLTALLTLQAYRGMKSGITSATEVTAKYIAETVNLNIRLKIIPLYNALKYLNHDDVIEAKTLKERKNALPLFIETLNSNPICSAVYIGYADGEIVVLSKIAYVYAEFGTSNLPLGAAFLFQSKSRRHDGSFTEEYCFYDASGKELQCNPTERFNLLPTERPWYQKAIEAKDIVITEPYLFYASNEVGVTIAAPTPRQDAVFGLDATTKDMNGFLDTLLITPNTKIILINADRKIISYSHTVLHKNATTGKLRLADISVLKNQVFDHLLSQPAPINTLIPFDDGQSNWYGLSSNIKGAFGNTYTILLAIPADELLAGARNNMYKQALIGALAVLILVFAGWQLGLRVVQPLQSLTAQVSSLGSFNFKTPIGINTHVKEVQALGNVLHNMSQTISNFLNISLVLNKEQNLENMVSSMLEHLLSLVHLPKGAIYLYDDKEQALTLAASQGGAFPSVLAVPDSDILDEPLERHVGDILPKTALAPLRNREGELVGLLCVACDQEDSCILQEAFLQFVDTISGSAAVAIETRQLIHAQKSLLSGIIKLIADAIDAKSQYTGGHCRRVPEIALMIMEELRGSEHSPFPDLVLTKQQEEEFRIAAWLHDCGKITTPEYVVDKATKLETIYNRIHEIRTRFEVLHRDAIIACLHAQLAGMSKEDAEKHRDAIHQQLQEEFAFVGKCNIGGEFMTQEDTTRLKQIGEKTWLRHFSLSVGLSRDELARFSESDRSPELPIQECLLADKPMHTVEWLHQPPVRLDDPNNLWGFDMSLPQNMYNYGEFYNLSIKKGTLTTEERFKINEHIVQTISMLKSLPLPGYLKRVPDIAGNHHEKMDGTGYPRKLHASQMSVPTRVMAIADVFEALTAADRPYKSGKKLSEALAILSKMGKEAHLDPALVNFFLKSRVYMRYAKKYMHTEQIDEINIEKYLISVPEDARADSFD